MKNSIFVVSSPLCFIYTLSIIDKMNIQNIVIIWVGQHPIAFYFPDKSIFENEKVIDLSDIRMFTWQSYKEHYESNLKRIKSSIKSVEYLFTQFDTDYTFELVRYCFSVKWNKVGIIEDGIGSYYKISMPAYTNKIMRSILNFFLKGFFLNISKYNLGGNKSIGTIATISPENVYIHKRSNASIVDIKNQVYKYVDYYKHSIPDYYKKVDCILFLVGIFNVNRISSNQLIRYIKFVKNKLNIADRDKFVIKPHPREDLLKLKKVLFDEFGDTIIIADCKPVEVFIKHIESKIMAGPPTTVLLNHFFLCDRNKTEYVLLPILSKWDKKWYSAEKVNVFKKIFNKKLSIYNFHV